MASLSENDFLGECSVRRGVGIAVWGGAWMWCRTQIHVVGIKARILVFQARQQVLLTRAGFSKDFGGYLATELWSVIFSQPENENHSELRKHILSQLNYKLTYSEIQQLKISGVAIWDDIWVASLMLIRGETPKNRDYLKRKTF